MVFGVAELLAILVAIGVVVVIAWGLVAAVRRGAGGTGPPRLPARDRAVVAEAIALARWVPGHDEVDGQTRVLVRRLYTGLDGRPEVLEERVLETFPAHDPAWEARFTEAMSRARFRCTYLNGEERPADRHICGRHHRLWTTPALVTALAATPDLPRRRRPPWSSATSPTASRRTSPNCRSH